MINYNDRSFAAVTNSENGETSSETVFYYKQKDDILTADYHGGKIVSGHLVGLVNEAGEIDMRYHHINSEGQLMTGICTSKPELLANDKIRLHEEWQWTSGDFSSGNSTIEEL